MPAGPDCLLVKYVQVILRNKPCSVESKVMAVLRSSEVPPEHVNPRPGRKMDGQGSRRVPPPSGQQRALCPSTTALEEEKLI